MLSSTLFRNSRRFPLFLRYTVEHALTSAGSLKERTIGHEVFGRDPAYDTSQDPIVRMTAAEVRKRLAQYYQMPEHGAEIVIAYQPGSYVPEFFRPNTALPAEAPKDEAPAGDVNRRGFRPPTVRVATLGLPALAVLLLIAFAALPGSRPQTAAAIALDRFWAPIQDAGAMVLLCIGDPTSPRSAADSTAQPQEPGDLTIDEFLRTASVRYTDSVTLALIAGELRVRNTPFRIRRPAATELQDLREGPVVLIGGFNNPWTLRLSEGLRFTLDWDERGTYIRDSHHPDSREWRMGGGQTLLRDIRETYGIITRLEDPATGQSVVAVSGLVLGTRAAGECLTDNACLAKAEALSRGNLDAANVQIVVATTVIGNNSGAPRVLAAHRW